MSGERITITRDELDELRSLAARLMSRLIELEIRLEDEQGSIRLTDGIPGVVSLDAHRARRTG